MKRLRDELQLKTYFLIYLCVFSYFLSLFILIVSVSWFDSLLFARSVWFIEMKCQKKKENSIQSVSSTIQNRTMDLLRYRFCSLPLTVSLTNSLLLPSLRHPIEHYSSIRISTKEAIIRTWVYFHRSQIVSQVAIASSVLQWIFCSVVKCFDIELCLPYSKQPLTISQCDDGWFFHRQ